MNKVDIDKDLKKEILEILYKLFNINKKTIYKDFHGFAISHGQDEIIDFIDDGIKFYEIANQYYQVNKKEKALEFYLKALDDIGDDDDEDKVEIFIEIEKSIKELYKDIPIHKITEISSKSS